MQFGMARGIRSDIYYDPVRTAVLFAGKTWQLTEELKLPDDAQIMESSH